jgi:tRNA (cytidine/uridine-2'-O-)-methyltransferase
MPPDTRPALALIQPDIAGNVGTLLRTAACFDAAVHIVEPCGFAFSDRALKRAGMDYAAQAALTRHADFEQFADAMTRAGRRLVLLTTAGAEPMSSTRFAHGDVLMLGSESSGAPAAAHEAAALRVRIPLASGFRSLNVAVAGGIALAEALRQTGSWPDTHVSASAGVDSGAPDGQG